MMGWSRSRGKKREEENLCCICRRRDTGVFAVEKLFFFHLMFLYRLLRKSFFTCSPEWKIIVGTCFPFEP